MSIGHSLAPARLKLVTLLRRRDGDIEAFHQRLLEAAAQGTLVPDHGATTDLVINLCNVRFDVVGLEDTSRAPYDAVLERYISGIEQPRRLPDPHGILGDQHTYLVEESQIKPDLGNPFSWPTPGVKCMYAIQRRNGLTSEEYRRHWRLVHSDLAVRHHIGMVRYVQDHIRDATEGAPPLDGIATLFFPSFADRRDRHIDSPQGQEVIDADATVFVGPTMTMVVSEYVQRAGRDAAT